VSDDHGSDDVTGVPGVPRPRVPRRCALWRRVLWRWVRWQGSCLVAWARAPRTATCPARARGLRERLPPCARAGL